MISVEEALEKILDTVDTLDTEEKPILECLGQVLGSDIVASIDIPPHDNSAMDGYAVKADDTTSASPGKPVYLKVIGEVPAGYIFDSPVQHGTAVRIMTGATIPDGADAVVQFENTDEIERKKRDRTLSEIGIIKPASAGLNIRRKGEDITIGQLVLSQGKVLRPADIGLLASLGHARASVIRRPVVAVLATGDELCDINEPLTAGKIYNSNTYTIAASILDCGGIPRTTGISRDNIKSLSDQIQEGLSADMLITTGGVSVGDYDIVKDVLAQMGKIGFWTVCMKPGKPLAFGLIKNPQSTATKAIPHLGLPGNPVSAMITFEQFARPALLKMMGKKVSRRPTVQAIIDSNIANSDRRRIFARVIVTQEGGRYHASLTGPQGSGILISVSKANGLAIIPEDCPQVKPGDTVTVQLLSPFEEIQ